MRLLAALAGAALILLSSTAVAAEQTREGYVAAVEPICKANTKANERILSGVRKQVKEGELKAAGVQFSKAAKALKKTIGELKAVPQPSADAARLGKWLSLVKTEADLFEAVATKLKAGEKTAAQAMVVRLTHNANLANNQVLAFEFTNCRLEPSKFT